MMNEDEKLSWKWLSGAIVRKDTWVDLRENRYLLPNGQEIFPYYTYRNKNFVVIVARDPEGNYCCVRQFRPGIEQVTTELPAGGIDPGEEPLAAAKRELLEETGCRADRWTALGKLAPNATLANNYAFCFLAEGCRKVAEQHLDATECMEYIMIPEEKMREMVLGGELPQAVHVAAFFLAEQARAKDCEAPRGQENRE